MVLFEEYVRGYDFSNDKIARKYSHTLRVKTLCELIAKELGLNNEQIALAGICGLYHDIGRFEQARIYNNFDDLKTIDHGDLGYEIFLKQFVDKLNLSSKDRQVVAKSIKHHNKFLVENLTEEELLFTNIVRDADKIDILYQLANVHETINDGEGEISTKIRNGFLERKPLNRKDVTNDKENNILLLAFIWDFNFECAYQIIKDNQYFDKIEKKLNNAVYNEYFAEIKKFLKEM